MTGAPGVQENISSDGLTTRGYIQAMKITRFQVDCVRVPMEPHRTANAEVKDSPLVLLTLHTDQGVSGQSLIFTYTPAALRPTGDLLRQLEPLVIDRTLAPSTISDSLHARFRLLGTQGMVGMALSAIDMAMWDALAKSQGLPLFKLLGGDRVALQVYGGIGYDGVEGSARSAESWARKGVRGIKAKIGYPTVEEDLAVIAAMRDAAGPAMRIMVDYNQSLSPTEARRRLGILDTEGLDWIEEPVGSHDFPAFARLASEVATPLQAGENWWGLQDFRAAVDAGVRDHMMPDVMKCGGVTGWMRISSLAHAYGIRISNHLWPEISAQLLACTPTALWLEYIDWWNPVLREPLQLEGDIAYPSSAPGSGMDLDQAAIERFRV
jgi:mandelate racemase